MLCRIKCIFSKSVRGGRARVVVFSTGSCVTAFVSVDNTKSRSTTEGQSINHDSMSARMLLGCYRCTSSKQRGRTTRANRNCLHHSGNSQCPGTVALSAAVKRKQESLGTYIFAAVNTLRGTDFCWKITLDTEGALDGNHERIYCEGCTGVCWADSPRYAMSCPLVFMCHCQ